MIQEISASELYKCYESLKEENKDLRNFIKSSNRRAFKIKALGKFNHVFRKNIDKYSTLCNVASIISVDEMKINFDKQLCPNCESKFQLIVKEK